MNAQGRAGTSMFASLGKALAKLSLVSKLCVIAALMIGGTQLAHAERKTTYYHTDGLGSVVAASDQSGAVLWRKEYAPFGEQLDSTAENEKLAYTGKEHDDVTGLTYFGARHYDPYLGRFTSVDPVGFVESNPMSFNRYAYANGNPYRFVDPDGRWAVNLNLVGLAGSFGRDRDSAQFFWSLRVGLTGAGVVIDPSKNAPRGEGRPLPGECRSCAVSSVAWHKGNIRAGVVVGPLSWQPAEYDPGTLVKEYSGPEETNAYFIEGAGWKFEGLNLESVLDPTKKKGLGIELEASYEWGSTIPDSSIRRALGMEPLDASKSKQVADKRR